MSVPLLIIIILLGIALVCCALCALIGHFFCRFAIARNGGGLSSMAFIGKIKIFFRKLFHPNYKPRESKPLMELEDCREAWFDEMNTETVQTASEDGLALRALLVVHPDSDKLVICCHGYRGRPNELGFIAEKYYDQGFSCLLPAARGHDISEGKYIGMGWPERRDVLRWIAYANERFNNPRIALYGISMGGATVMMTSGEDLPANVRCIVEDCGYSSIKRQYEHCMKNMVHMPVQPILGIGRLMIKLEAGYDSYEGSSVKQLAKCTRPMLFIHGTDDKFVPFSMLDEVCSAHPGPKELYVVDGALHASSAFKAGEEYFRRMFAFVSKYIDA